uniref:Ewing tumor-associated antigen 1 n=1 Tax=Nothobranchius furzeri TaxID=105023 RepID=A0A1A7ZX26_NOTFU
MSGSARSPEFSELWRNHLCKVESNKSQDRRTEQKIPGITSHQCRDLLSPRLRGCSRYPGLNNGDSPGDVEASQDIIWDSTSPTQTGSGHRNTRVVEISDLVNRIIPKNIKQKRTESPFFHWIDDGTIASTPEIPKSRVRKRSSRRSRVEDLVKLAKQLDQNMQQDDEPSEQLRGIDNNLPVIVDTTEAKLVTSSLNNGKDLKWSQPYILWNKKKRTITALITVQTLTMTGSAVHPVEQKETNHHSTNYCADFDDDWDNDDLLNDSFVLALTQNPYANPRNTIQSDSQRNTDFSSVSKPTTETDSAHKPEDKICKMSCSALQELCPKPKTTNRSTFKLESNLHFKPTFSTEGPKSNFTEIQPESKMTGESLAGLKPFPTSLHKVSNDQVGTSAVKDHLWDDRDDDALLYQICDSVEQISNGQSKEVGLDNGRKEQDITVVRRQKSTKPVTVDTTTWAKNSGIGANRRSSGGFVRSNSLPGTSCGTNYQGWNVPMKGANSKSGISQSFPESHVNLCTFNQSRDFSGTFQAGSNNVEVKPHALIVREPSNSKSHHATFKRNVSDSAIISSKVFISGQTTGKCSAAEIERKKQEALARRRLRMQNTSKP